MIVLNDYIICFDGTAIVDPSNLFKYASFVDSDKLQITELTPDIRKYNSMCSQHQRLKIWDPDKKIDLPAINWYFDSQVKTMSNEELFKYVCNLYANKILDKDSEYIRRSTDRLLYEWKLFIQNDLINLLRALISTINIMTRSNVCWGPGRGSSTSSYLLFVVGLHDVDCIEYDIDVHDFIRR